MMGNVLGSKWCGVVVAVLWVSSLASATSKDSGTPRILLIGDSWSMFTAGAPLGTALHNKGFDNIGFYMGPRTVRMGSGVEEWAENRDRAEGALQAVVEALQQNPSIDIVFFNLGFDIIFGRWKAIEDFDPPITPAEYAVWEAGVWQNMKYGGDGQHGLKLIFDTILAVRPDVKILHSSYDYVGSVEPTWDMTTVQKYNVGMERFTGAVIDLINTQYRHPARVFLVNNLGLTQYTWGYPGPDPGAIPAYFWPPPGTPHPFRFGPGPAPNSGDPPLYPGNEASGYAPLAGGDPSFRISPYIAQFDPPISGWVHLSSEGYRVVAEHAIVEYMGAWFQTPKVNAVKRATRYPCDPTRVYDPTGLAEVAFEVTFSEPVLGVDPVDFAPVMHGGLANASIEDVAEAEDGATYLVTVNTGSGNGTLGLAVLDDDSIVDAQSNPLGGAGLNNGCFAYGEEYHIDRSVSLPTRAWPIALVLFAVGLLMLRRLTSSRGDKGLQS